MLPRELLLRLTHSHSHHTRLSSLRFISSTSTSSSSRPNVIHQLEQRGLLSDLTSRAVRTHVENPTTVYLGVDPSASSLHVGNLLALIGLIHFRLHGHNTIALIGGATGSVGDPSGRSTERNALPPHILNHNIQSITKQIQSILTRGIPFAQSRSMKRYAPDKVVVTEGGLRVENNLNWLEGLGLLEFLSQVGKGARMSTMLSRESVRSRLDSTSGLSFTEFTYQLLQAYDFLTLHKRYDCTIQLGGSDQLGNIQSGIEMIRKHHSSSSASEGVEETVGLGEEEDKAYGVTMPLLTNSAGEKFGKSAGNAVWLDSRLTRPFEFYQFFLRTSDEDALKYLKIFTFVRVIELEGIMEEHNALPNARVAQKILAAEVTELVHGTHGLQQALAATQIFFSPASDLLKLNIGNLTESLDAKPTLSVRTSEEVPSMLVRLKREEVVGKALEVLVVGSGLVASKTQARRSIDAGTITLNGNKLPPKSHQKMIEEEDILEGGLIVLKSGKTAYKAVLLE